VDRLEENVGAKESLLLTEREQNASTLKLLAEAHLEIDELIRKLEDSDRKSDSLQSTIKRSDR
jgi:myosin-5